MKPISRPCCLRDLFPTASGDEYFVACRNCGIRGPGTKNPGSDYTVVVDLWWDWVRRTNQHSHSYFVLEQNEQRSRF